MSKIGQYIFIVALSVFFLIPIVFDFLELKFSGEFNNEKRTLAKFPQPLKSGNTIRSWVQDFESYSDDNIAYRNIMVPAYNTILYLLNESPTERIAFGKNKWIYNNYDFAIDQLTGKKKLTKHHIDFSIENILETQFKLAKRDIPFYFFVAPNKSSIYPEHLPSYISVTEKSNFDKFYTEAIEKGVKILNIHECLESSKETNPDLQLYYTSDTHWNFSGAYYAYNCINQVLQTELKITAGNFSENEYSIKEYDKYFGLLERLGTYPIFSDAGKNIEVNKNGNYKRINSEKNKGHITEGRKITIYQNDKVTNNTTVLLIGDSFNGYIAPYYASKFNKVVVTPHNRGNWDTSLISKHKPDIVIFEILERLLINGISKTKW